MCSLLSPDRSAGAYTSVGRERVRAGRAYTRITMLQRPVSQGAPQGGVIAALARDGAAARPRA